MSRVYLFIEWRKVKSLNNATFYYRRLLYYLISLSYGLQDLIQEFSAVLYRIVFLFWKRPLHIFLFYLILPKKPTAHNIRRRLLKHR